MASLEGVALGGPGSAAGPSSSRRTLKKYVCPRGFACIRRDLNALRRSAGYSISRGKSGIVVAELASKGRKHRAADISVGKTLGEGNFGQVFEVRFPNFFQFYKHCESSLLRCPRFLNLCDSDVWS
jgi:hypothetical protein